MILVTGATGLLGTHVLYELASSGQCVRALFRDYKKIELTKQLLKYYQPDNHNTLEQFIEWKECDILDIVQLNEAMEGITHIYHCAAIVSFKNGEFSRLITANREGTANVVNIALAHQVKKLCHVSSTAAVGKPLTTKNTVVRETNKWEQNEATTGYAISKHLAEKEVWRGIEEGLNAVIVNPCVILGPGNWNESSLTIFRAIQKGMWFYPPGANAIVDARDVAKRMIFLMNSPVHSERFLIIGEHVSFKKLFDGIASKIGKRKPFIPVKKWLIGISWRMASLVSFLTQKPTSLTKQSAITAFSTTTYSTDKMDELYPETYIKLEDIIENVTMFNN